MNQKNRFRLLLIFFLAGIIISPALLRAQQTNVQYVEDMVNWTENGMVVFVSDAALSPDMPQTGRVQGIIYRSVGDSTSYEEIGRLGRAESLEEFKERASDDLMAALLESTDAETEEEVWEFVKEHPKSDDYGFLAFDSDFWKAFGTAYFDTESIEFPEGETVYYQIRYLMDDGSVSDYRMVSSDVVGHQPRLLRPQVIDRMERDSLVSGTWSSPIEGSEDAFFGYIYKQMGDDGEFERLPERLMARRNEDSLLVYQWEEAVEPERAYRYFIEPVDLVGNTGPRSDTLTVISVDFEKLPLLGNVTAIDTTAGIHLSWEKIPQKPYLTGIEIRRSRDARKEFITLDTLSTQATEYLDTQLIPNKSYYYEFRIVTMRPKNELPSAVASASFKNEMMAPAPPSGLTAVREGEGIRLDWDSVEEPDLFAYYVYRGTSRYDSLVVASPAIKDTTTFFDDNEILSGRTNYVYAVKAVNLSEMESDLSEMVVIRPDRVVRPPAPTGIEGYAEQQRIRLVWRDQTSRDNAVEGYNIYRSRSPLEMTPDSAAAADQAEQAGFEKINEELITTTAFDDTSIESGQTYYYALSSMDAFGVESLMSNPAGFTGSTLSLRPPSQVSVRPVSEGIELRWNQTLQDGATGYRIFRRSRGQSESTAIGLNDLEETRFLDQDISSGELYWYSVAVVGEERESFTSREESVRAD
ncbi:fibronectin type III domain-containing protein [Rhodohalobacter sp. 614A]|uniref:fibronectin type III domain-containing protein n=1 Tax=Rhodohalobacter sp. 614A TaxID=2908649 RepID=UPI001F2BA2E3|nr:fibronectin type III domain-containing protein [Rhodohalobacter sp. 614A]